jgi:2-iminobutanoate/2-iminopropanoate deaminase
MRKQLFPENAAPPKGIYSPGIVTKGTMVFMSGQGPVDPETGEFQLGSFAEQAELTFKNLTALLEAAGTSWSLVVKVGIFLADDGDFKEMNEIYKQFLSEPYPARTTIEAGLPPGTLIEVDCIAVVPEE